MTQNQYRTTLQREIKKLNEQIDDLILSGRAYTREARRHKDLIKKMRRIEKSPFWGRAFGFGSLF
jgi:tartrate dehydratase beta subunit/fumarate hydratase class I family protein